jgi:chromosome segregation ATPase
MPRRPSGRPTGRPRKPADPAPVSTAVTATAPAPGSPEAIAEIATKLASLDPSVFKTGQVYDTTSENLRHLLAHHKELQTRQAEAQAAARLDKVPALEETIATLTRESETAKRTISSLKDKIERLEPRVSSADLWDAQVSRLATEAKAEEDRIAEEEAQAKEQKRREDFLTKYQARVNQDIKNEDAEKTDANAHRVDVRGVYVQFGQPGCDLYNRHQAELTKRATNLRYLSYAQRLMTEKEFTFEQAKALEASFQNAASAKARQAQHAEDTRQHMDPTREFDPSFDYVAPIPNQSDHAPTRGQKVYDYGFSETMARWEREGGHEEAVARWKREGR